MKLEAKGEFITAFCRIVGSLQPQCFQEIQLINIPRNLNLSNLQKHQSLESLLNPLEGKSHTSSDKADLTAANKAAGGDGSTAYRALTEREEADIRQFLNELDAESAQCNATELTEHLQKQLADVEGTNIHSIMASEPEVLKLMTTLDEAITQAEKWERQMNDYHQYLADVEEAMSTLRDRDHLIQVTMDNRGRLLKALEDLVTHHTLDAKYVRALMNVNLATGTAECIEAAHCLDALLNAETMPGEEHLRAVAEQKEEFHRLRDSFTKVLAQKVNDTLINFARQLIFVGGPSSMDMLHTVDTLDASQQPVSTSIRGSLELYAVQHNKLNELAPLVGGWLQTNRKDVYTELKREYVRQFRPFFRMQISEMLVQARQSITMLVRPPKGGHHCGHRKDEVAPSEMGSVLSIKSPEASILTQVASFVNDLVAKLQSFINTEEDFVAKFFQFSRTPPGSAKPQLSPTGSEDVETLSNFMAQLFLDLETDAFKFVTSCEQLLPILAMPLLVVVTRAMDLVQGSQPQEPKSAKNQSIAASRQSVAIVSERSSSLSFSSYILSCLVMASKRAFNRYIERMLQSYRETKPITKSRCGVLRMVRNYADFAESSMTVFQQSARLGDLERAHAELVRTVMAQLELVASQSVKTPREVVQLENYHRLNDILRRLKLSSTDEYLQECKHLYTRALQEYTKNSMGRPLEKLATFFEGVQAALNAGIRPEAIQYQFAFSKQELRKVIREYPGREVKKGLESLCKKVEKHLSEEENLFQVVWRSIQAEFFDQCQLFNVLIQECYPDAGISLEFTIDNLQNFFTEIARSR